MNESMICYNFIMTEQHQDYFSKIQVQSEKLALFQELVTKDEVILCRSSSHKSVNLYSRRMIGPLFYCQLRGETPPLKEEVVLSFQLDVNRYFVKTVLEVSNDEEGVVYFSIEKGLYRLQRRSNFRVTLPSYYGAYFYCRQKNNQDFIEKLRVDDVSASGCQLYMQSVRELNEGDHLIGTLSLGPDKPNLELTLTIKRKRAGTNGVGLGMQIEPSDKRLMSKLMSLVLEIHRELFLSWKLD